jgi:dCTP deaminase
MSAGVLSKQQIRELIDPSSGRRVIEPAGGVKLKIDGSSFDLPIGTEYWEMKGSCRAGKGLNVGDIIRKYACHENPKPVGHKLRLIRNNVYLFKVGCKLDLHQTGIQGKATGRSSIGRLDVLVRLLTDGATSFDHVELDYKGELFLEVTPITFDLFVRPGTRLSQLRLFRGNEHLITLTREALLLEQYDDTFPVLDANGALMTEVRQNRLQEFWFPFCLDLSPDPSAGCCGFMAKKGISDPVYPDRKNKHEPIDFWDPVLPDEDLMDVGRQERAIRLKTDCLYILRSKERLRIPPHLCLECQAYTETMGEWRIEYAGFAHPWFGRTRPDKAGTPIIFEVRGHNIPTILTDGIPLGNVCFRRMSLPVRKPTKLGVYEKQELKLSSCFKPWPAQGA